MITLRRHTGCLIASATAVILTGGCSGSAGPDDDVALAACTPTRLDTAEKGKLILSTGAVTRAPWVVGGVEGKSGDPRDGKGYDAAVGFALADRLGFARDAVTWKGTAFPTAVAPGEKDFDININQATITPERKVDVDLSVPYYFVRQAVVTLSNRRAARAERLADLAEVTFAVVEGSVARKVVTDTVMPARPPVAYPELDEVRAAVSDDRQPAMVVDFQTALKLAREETQLVDGALVGLLPLTDEPSEAYGLVLEKDSALTDCVNAALTALRNDGTLERLERQWLIEEPGYRDFR